MSATLVKFLGPLSLCMSDPLSAGTLGQLQALQPVSIRARELPELQGRPLGYLGAFVWREGWTPVPLQVDEVGEDGLYVLDSGPKPGRSDGIFAGQDELLLLPSGHGNRAPAGAPPPCAQTARAERRFEGEGTQGGWVYLVSCSDRPASTMSGEGLRIDEGGYRVRLPDHTVEFSRTQPLEPSSLVIASAWGGTGQNILHALHVEGQARWLGGWLQLRRTLEDFISELSAWKVGPLRAIRRTIPRIRTYGTRYTNPGTFVLDSLHVPGMLSFALHMRSGTDLSRLVSSLALQVAWEFRMFKGMGVRFSAPIPPLVLDASEVEARSRGIQSSDSDWIFVGGGQGGFLGRISYETGGHLEKRLLITGVGPDRFRVGYSLEGLERTSKGHSVFRADFVNLVGGSLRDAERAAETYRTRANRLR